MLRPIPEGVEIETHGDTLIITQRWFVKWHIALIPICIMFLISGFYNCCLFIPFLLIPLYITLVMFLNKSTITVNPCHITVEHQPLPFRGGKRISAKNIEQLYCKKHVKWYYREYGGKRITYELHVITAKGHEKLVGKLENREHAKYIEQEIERFLSIKDIPVRGELPD